MARNLLLNNQFLKRIELEKKYINEFVGCYLFSGNYKTEMSINFPLLTCTPSKVCIDLCYALKGRLVKE